MMGYTTMNENRSAIWQIAYRFTKSIYRGDNEQPINYLLPYQRRWYIMTTAIVKFSSILEDDICLSDFLRGAIRHRCVPLKHAY
jgi:hypothetical protein